MKTKGALCWEVGKPWTLEEIDVGDPRTGEVQVRLAATGLCHSDEHFRNGDVPPKFLPILGGHEGAGVITKVGPSVEGLVEGDHVVLGFVPSCGRCIPCATGHQNLCDLGAGLMMGASISDGTYRVTVGGAPVLPLCLLGTFAPYVTCHASAAIKIEKDIPLDKAALLGCGVTTGWGSATIVADTRPGDTVVVVGIGGIGINAVQGAAMAGAERVVAIDPVAFKREQAALFGATHTYSSMEDALEPVRELTWGRMADSCILTVGQIQGEHIAEALALVRKGGTAVVTAMGNATSVDVKLSLADMTVMQKTLKGALFGGANPRADIYRLLHLYRDGQLKLDELVTTTYRHEEVEQGYLDMEAGRNLRGMVVYGDADY
jgi:S-(hydroxymethyl)glutathione dehydrogenase/alcohol dehydrogenase